MSNINKSRIDEAEKCSRASAETAHRLTPLLIHPQWTLSNQCREVLARSGANQCLKTIAFEMGLTERQATRKQEKARQFFELTIDGGKPPNIATAVLRAHKFGYLGWADVEAFMPKPTH